MGYGPLLLGAFICIPLSLSSGGNQTNVVRALGYSSRLMEEDEGPKSSAGIPVSIPGYDSSPIDDLQRAHVDSSDVVEAEDSAARLQAAESAYEKQADFIDDLNDLTHAMMTLLPQRCWLELDACYPSGEFDIPGLAVNKLLNLTSDNLSSLLGTQGGRNLQKGVIFRAGPVGRLARSNGVRAIFIYVDSTGRGPSEGPGAQIIGAELRRGDFNALSESDKADVLAVFETSSSSGAGFYSLYNVPQGGWTIDILTPLSALSPKRARRASALFDQVAATLSTSPRLRPSAESPTIVSGRQQAAASEESQSHSPKDAIIATLREELRAVKEQQLMDTTLLSQEAGRLRESSITEAERVRRKHEAEMSALTLAHAQLQRATEGAMIESSATSIGLLTSISSTASKLEVEVVQLRKKEIAAAELQLKFEALQAKSSRQTVDLTNPSALSKNLVSLVSQLGPSQRASTWSSLMSELRHVPNGRSLKRELKNIAIDGCFDDTLDGQFFTSLGRTHMASLISIEREHAQSLTPATVAAHLASGGASVVIVAGTSPWIDPITGGLHQYDLAADIQRKKTSGGGVLWNIVESVVTSANAKKDLQRMERCLNSTKSGGPYLRYFPHGPSDLKRPSLDETALQTEYERRLRARDLNIITILDQVVSMNQSSMTTPGQLLVYRTLASSAAGQATNGSIALQANGGRQPGLTELRNIEFQLASNYLSRWPALLTKLVQTSVESEGAAEKAQTLVLWRDNFVVRPGLFAKNFKVGDNSRTLSTEQGLVAVPRVNLLISPDARTGDPVGSPFDEGRVRLVLASNPEILQSRSPLGCHSLILHGGIHFGTWLPNGLVIPVDKHIFRLREAYPQPSADSKSSKLSDYKEHFLKYYQKLIPELFDNGHPCMVHDSEYVAHMLRCMEEGKHDPELRALIKNIILIANYLHNRKALCLASLQFTPHVVEFISPLLTEVTVYAKTKWRDTGLRVRNESEAAFAAVAQIAAVTNPDDHQSLMKLAAAIEVKERAEDALADYIDVADADFALNTSAAEFSEQGDGDDHENTPTAVVTPLSALSPDSILAAVSAISDDEDEDEEYSVLCGYCLSWVNKDDEPSLSHLTDDELEALDFKCSQCNASPGNPAPSVQVVPLQSQAQVHKLLLVQARDQIVARGLLARSAVDKMKKADCHNLLILQLQLPPKIKVAKPHVDEVTWNLARHMATYLHITKRWNGAAMGPGGSDLKRQFITECHRVFGFAFTDVTVVAMACDSSSFIYGLYNFIDREICELCTIPFINWQHGNVTPFLTRLPMLCALIASSPRKPKCARNALFTLERAILYSQHGGDVLQHFGANSSMLREDHEENHHSVLSHFVNKHVAAIKAKHYIHASCLTKSIGDVKREMKSAFLNRKDAPQEEDILFARTDKPSFAETNEALDAFILRPFMTCLKEIKDNDDGVCTTYPNSRWPRELTDERILSGPRRLVDHTLPMLVKYLARVSRECSGGGGSTGADPRTAEAAAIPAQSVKQFLETATVEACLKPECRRRGLQVSGKKAELVERILQHIILLTPAAKYKNMDHKDKDFGAVVLDLRPAGFSGQLDAAQPPPESP